MPRSLSPATMSRRDVTPAARSSAMTEAIPQPDDAHAARAWVGRGETGLRKPITGGEADSACEAAVEATTKAIDFARDEVRRCRTAVAAAEQNVESAKANYSNILVARARVETRTATKTAEARSELESARDDLDCAVEAVKSLEAELKARESDLHRAGSPLRACVQSVIRPDPATHAFLKHFREHLEPNYLRARGLGNRCPLLHPEGTSKATWQIDVPAAEQPWNDWERPLHTDADATLASQEK
jgi:hypothetical protein